MRAFPFLAFALAPLLLVACGGSECEGEKCDTALDTQPDDTDAAPCDPSDLSVTPESEEICDGVDNNCNGEVDEGVTSDFFPDVDGDGFGDTTAAPLAACEAPDGWVQNALDCDDADRSIYPDAPEVCDHLDNDCDGERDEDVGVERWVDGDGDGFGDPGTGALTCDADAGYVENDRDCDDTDPGAAPDAEEICDEVDNDCDGVVDDGVTVEFYADLDGDGHGDASLAVAACVVPTGYAVLGDDCDDDAAGVYPGADEVCDGLDQDCDGEVDEGALDSAAFYADGDGDGYGAGAAWIGCTPPAGYVATDTDCDDSAAAVNPAGAEVCNGLDDNCDGDVDEATATDAATWYGDADGDGYGASTFTVVSCDVPAGYVASDDDCDDLDGAV
jgi:large repetitive protein